MDRARSRGQLLLVAGLGIAVTLVTLAVVLNTAIYTENLATRDTVPGREAVAFERTAEDGVGDLLALVNRYNNTDYGALNRNLTAEVTAWDNQSSRHGAAYGSVRSATLRGVDNGTRILQDDHRNFTAASATDDWRLAADVTRVRRFRANVTRSDLNDSASDAFAVVVSNGSQEWTATVSQSGTDDVTVAVDNGTTTTYDATGETVEIDFTEGTVGGEARSFDFAEGVTPPYDVSYENGSEVAGRYVLFVDRPKGPLLADEPGGAYNDRASGDSPYTVRAIYAANVSLVFERPDLTYESNLTVAPAGPPGNETYTVAG